VQTGQKATSVRGQEAAGADLPHLISKIHAPAAGRV